MTFLELPLICDDWQDYALLDSGAGRKLERYGEITVSRPESQALWSPTIPVHDWSCDAVFSAKSAEQDKGAWEVKAPLPDQWPLKWSGQRGDIVAHARLSPFRHMGLFPEHSVHWRFAQSALLQNNGGRVLNLFGYTGMASLACASVGAEVTHCDASPQAVGFGRNNQTLSGLEDAPIRWIVDDAIKFLGREARRGRKYDGIILDPPKFGRGPKNEKWQFNEMLPDLLSGVRAVLSERPLFMIITSYAVRLSYVSLAQVTHEFFRDIEGHIQTGEMFIAQENSDRRLPMALYAIWTP